MAVCFDVKMNIVQIKKLNKTHRNRSRFVFMKVFKQWKYRHYVFRSQCGVLFTASSLSVCICKNIYASKTVVLCMQGCRDRTGLWGTGSVHSQNEPKSPSWICSYIQWHPLRALLFKHLQNDCLYSHIHIYIIYICITQIHNYSRNTFIQFG